ncbi:MAG: hypothetical protein AAF389_08020 [Gemmatimonadota bacterium]
MSMRSWPRFFRSAALGAALFASGCVTENVITVTVGQVTVTPVTANLFEGETGQFEATVEDESGRALSRASVTWVSADPTIAWVDSVGMVTALTEGTVELMADFRGVQDTATITVIAAPEVEFEVDSAAFNAAVGTLGPEPAVVVIQNGGGAQLTDLTVAVVYPPGGPTGWLDVSLDRTLAPASMTIAPMTASLPVGSYSATISVSSPVDPDSPHFLPVTISIAGITVSESGGDTQVNESGTTDSVTVVLDVAPDGPVVVDVISADPGEVTAAPLSLTFDPTDWNIPQTVVVTGIDELVSDGDQITPVVIAVDPDQSDDRFDPIPGDSVPVTTVDDDTPGFTVVESGGSTSVDESGTSDDVSVVLDVEPLGPVLLDVSSSDPTEASVTPSTLTFTPGNWASPQTVTVVGVDDDLLDGSQASAIVLAVDPANSDDAFDTLAPDSVAVTTTDDDDAGIAITAPGGLPIDSVTVTETGSTANFEVSLTAQPASDVVLSIVSADLGEATVAPGVMIFNASNWNVPVSVTVTGIDDDILDGDQITPITVAVDDANSDDNFDAIPDAVLPARTVDDDTAGFLVQESGGGSSVEESGTTDDLTVVLLAEPTSDVVLDVSSADVGEVTVSTTSLTFTTANWDTPQTVTLTGVDELIDDGDQLTDVTISVNDAASDDDFDTLADEVTPVTTVDDDTAGFTIVQSGGGTQVAESGTTDDFTVVLDSEPLSDVVLTMLASDPSEASIAPTSLTFTPVTWNVPQTVTVTGVDDIIDDENQFSVIAVAVSAALSDDTYDPLPDQTVQVTTTDDDSPAGFTVTEISGTSVSESGTTDDLTVVLDTEPASDVVLNVTSGDVGEVVVDQSTLTFTPTDWATPQTIVVTGVDDDVLDGPQPSAITFSVDAAASDDNFDPLPDTVITAITADDDVAGFTVTESDGTTVVSEGGTTDDLFVVLDAEPSSNVQISAASGDLGEATVAPPTLTFSPASWNTPQTFTVTGVDDATIDGSANTAITLAVVDAQSDDAFDPVADQVVTAITTDNDLPGISVVETGGSTEVSESGTSDEFTVVLDSEPTTDVVVNVTSSDPGETSPAPVTLTFTNANWNVPRTVVVSGVDDAIIDGTQSSTLSVTVDDALSDDQYDGLSAQVTANTTDDDGAGVTVAVTGGTITVSETGTTGDFTAVLEAEPASAVVLDVVSDDPSESSVSVSQLNFTPGNWNVPQQVVVQGVDDDLIDGTQPSTISVSVNALLSDDAYDGVPPEFVSVNTTDNDLASFSVTESGGGTLVAEGGAQDDFEIVLGAQPSSDVVIDLVSADNGETVVSPTTLTFTSVNWNVPQTVLATGVDDDIIDGNQFTVVTISVNDANSDDDFDPLADQSITVTTADDDAAGFVVVESGATTEVDESGTTDDLTVSLTAQPTSNVVLTVISADVAEVSVSAPTLTFTPATWDTPQVVTVTGVDELIDDGDATTIVTVAVDDALSDDDFDAVADETVSVLTTDDDTAGFTISETDGGTLVTEAGSTDDFAVVLDTEPVSNVVLDISSADIGEATASPATLTFTPANWLTPQTVTVTGVDDLLDDGSQFTAVSVAVNDASSDDAFDDVVDQSVSVTTTDDDEPVGITVTAIGGTTVTEAGSSDDFTVVLDAEPASNVQIDVTTDSPDETSVTPSPLVFTPANWDTPQTVTVTGVDDDIIDGTQASTITVAVDDLNSAPAYTVVPDETVPASTTDDDVAGFVINESDGTTIVNETAGVDQIGVVLTAQPATNVVITLVSGDLTEATAAPPSLTFGPGTWDTEQFFNITGVDDADIDGTQVTTFTFAVDDANSDDDFDPLPDQTVDVTTTDDDAPGITITPTGGSTSVDESGTTDDFTVVLDRGPATNVVLLLSSADVGEATVSPTSLTFTPVNWATPQSVTLTGVDDAEADGDQLTTITISVDDANSDDVYDPLPDETIVVTTVDDDVPGFTITETAGNTSVSEAGTTDDFSVVLDAQPATAVSLTVTSGDVGEATVSVATLTFTNANWDTPQSVTVTGVDDAIIDGAQVTSVTISVDDVSSDDEFDPLPDQTVSVTTLDDDLPGFAAVETDGGTLVTEAGSTDELLLFLLSQPASDVVLTITSSDPDEAAVDQPSLTFTPITGSAAQTITVSGVDDSIIDGSQLTTITVSVDDANSDDDFDPLADQNISVTTNDDDSAGFLVSESGVSTTVTEAGGLDSVTVVLTAEPASNVVITATSADVDETTVTPTSLTFTPGDWDTPQALELTGIDELIDDGDQSTDLTLNVDDANSDDDFDPLPDQLVSVTTLDDDNAGITVTETGGGTLVTEAGSSDDFTVALDSEPTSDVVIDVASGDVGEATVSPAALTFTAANWDTPQGVTVTGVDDLIDDGNQFTVVTISVDDAASDDTYDPVLDGSVTVTTTDDDAPVGFTVAEIGGTQVTEAGSTDAFAVVLNSEPGSDVVFTVTSADVGEATVDQASLTFTPANWDTPQTVTVTGVDDALIDGTQNTDVTVSVDDANSDDAFDPLADQVVTVSTSDDDVAGYDVVESGGSTLVNESGTTDDFTVALTAQPVSDVVFTVTSSDTDEATVTPGTLTFTNANWDTPQSVTVTGIDDVLVDGSQTSVITVSVDDPASDDDFDTLADQTFNATITDDDAPGISIAESAGTTSVDESGTTDDFTVVLDRAPLTDVVLDVSSADVGEATVDQPTLTFTAANWDTPQVVTVIGVDDALNDGDQVALVTVSVNDAASDDTYDLVPDLTVSVTTTDDDAAGITIVESAGSTQVTEAGSTDDFTVVLDAQPSTNVTLNITSGDVGEATVSSATLTFTNANWDTPQNVTVTGVDDAILDGDQVTTITVSVDDLTSDDAYDPLPDLQVSATTTDDDLAGFTIAESGGGSIVSEAGSTDDFTVVLDSEPASSVVLDITSGDVGEVTVDVAQLTFTSADWATPQVVTLTGIDDAVIDGSQLTSITVAVNDAASDDDFDPLANQLVSVTTTDDDVASFTVTEVGGSTAVTEAGSTDQLSVVLGAEPTSDVVLTVTSGDLTEVTVSVPSLTFTAANWNTPQLVTLTGVDDDIDDGDQSTTITVAVDDANSDDGFDPLPDQTVSAITSDDDTAGFTVTESLGSTSVNETGTTDDFTVVLDTEPVSNVVLTVTSADLTEVTAAPTSLTFTPANWDTPQTVTLTGEDDLENDGNQVTTVSVAVNDGPSDDTFDPLPDQNVTVTTVDNDLAGFTVTETSGGTSVSETGTTDDFTVVLTAQPATNVVIDVTSSDTGEATVAPTTLTFTPGNWDQAQTVTVTGIDDPFDDGDQFSTVTVAVDDANSDDAFDPLADQTVSVTTLDDDGSAYVVAETGGSTDVTEGGGTDTFSVVLSTQPTSNVVIDVTSGDTGEVTVDVTSLTFTPGNWDTPQNVTATGVDDDIDDGDVVTLVNLSVDDALSDDTYDALADQTVGVTTTDDDTAGFTVSESAGSTSVTEAGSTDDFTVVLDTEPVSNVVISVVSGDVSEATVDQATLTFTPADWDTPQSVVVTGVDDDVDDGDQVTPITIAVVDGSSDDAFDGVADQQVSPTTTDDDTAGFTVTETAGNTVVSESGTTDDFTIVLDAAPETGVVFTVTSGDPGEATVNAATVTFTPLNWNTPQTVVVTGVDDALQDGDQVTTITISVDDGASDDTFDPLPDQTVSATTTDDDTAGFTVTESGGSTSVSEAGTTDDFSVVLDTEPTSNVVLTVVSADVGEVTVDQATLTFTPGNWNSPQTVTVTGVDDVLTDGPVVTAITIAVDDANSDDTFDPLADQSVIVTTLDDDAPGFQVTESGPGTTVTEAGGGDTFDVVLTAQPNSDVVFDVSSADTGEATVGTATLTFTNANWSTPQTVTVTGVDDDIVDGDVVTLVTVSVNDAASDDDFDGLPDQAINVTTTDDDLAGYTVTETGGTTAVSETGTSDLIEVVLTAAPLTNVVVAGSSADTGEATLSPATLTFTPANWDTPQNFTVTGVDDAVLDGNVVTLLTFSIDDAGSDNAFDPLADQTVSVTTVDDDVASFTVTESAGTTIVSESGTTDDVSIVLDAQPLAGVVFDISSGDPTEATTAPATITFTTSNWDTPQSFIVTGVDDAFDDGDASTLITVSINTAGSDAAWDALASQTVTATTTDDDVAAFFVTETGGGSAVSETGTTDSLSVVLGAQPASNVVVTVSSADLGEVTAAPTPLVFTPGDWNTPQIVTLTGVDDALIDGTTVTNVTLAINDASSDDDFDALPDQIFAVSNTDDDVAGYTVTEDGSTTVNEGGTTDNFTVVLDAQPSSDVVFTVVSADIGEATVDQATLTFTPANWNSAQTVTVTGVDEAVVDGDQVTTVTVSVDDANSDDAFDPLTDTTVSVTTIDDDGAGIMVTESGGSTVVSEAGSTDDFTVVLTAQPLTNVVIDVTSGDTGEATVSTGMLTFTTGNWDTPQQVTVTGVDDLIDDESQFTSVTISVNDALSDDTFDPVDDQIVTVTTTDDDDAGFTIAQSGGGTSVNEGGSTDDFTVVLTAEPATNVVFDVTSADPDEAAVAPSQLTFTAGNWNTPQQVTVTGVDDDYVDGFQFTLVTVAVDDVASDDAYDPLADQQISVSTLDDDVASYTVTESGGTTTVDESGTTDDFTIVLGARPFGNVVFNVSSADAGEATVSPSTVSFDDTNWDTPQAVTVTGVDDFTLDGTQITSITVSINQPGTDPEFDALADQFVSVSTTSDDVAGFTLTETAGTTVVTEAGSTDQVTVELDAEPASNVVIDVSSPDLGEVTVLPAQLTFTPGNWNVPQPVTLTGVDDDLDDGDIVTLVSFSVNAAGSDDDFDGVAGQTVSTTTSDDDTAGFTITETSASTVVTEAASTDQFDVVLDSEPFSNVTLDISSSDTGEATVSTPSITFTPGNWNTPVTVTVTGVDDAVDDGDIVSTVTVSVNDASSDDQYDPLADQFVSVTTIDDDGAFYTVTESGGTTVVTENGTTDDISIQIGTEPVDSVVIDISSADTGEVTVLPTSLVFNSSNWTFPQVVTLTGVDDGDLVDGDVITTITVSVNDAASDAVYGPLADQTVGAENTDNDAAGFTVTETAGTTAVAEDGGTDQVSVVLTGQPVTDVVLDVSIDDATEASVSVGQLTFTNANWNTPQNVTITGLDDTPFVDGDQTSTLTVSVNDIGSADPFDPLADQTVTVTTTDTDVASYTVTESGLGTTVSESGSTDDFTVVLDAQPATNVVYLLSSDDTGEATVSPSTLTFTSGNWNTAQTVTVTGVSDTPLADGDQVSTITVAVDDANSFDPFDPLADQTVSVTTTDIDAPNFAVTPSGGTTVVSESGTTDDIDVVLTRQPLTDVVISVSSGDTGEATVDLTQLTFTNTNWATPQTVTVTGVGDAPLADGDQTTIITFAVVDALSDDEFDPVADQTVSATTTDIEVASFTITETGGFTVVNEDGTTDGFSVVLDTQPVTDVVVDVSSGSPGEATAAPTQLTFTNADWNIAQVVTVTGVDDSPLVDGPQNSTITISIDDAASDDVWDPVLDQTINVQTLDTDIASFTIVESADTTFVEESGTTDDFTVVLDAQPTDDVVLTVTSGDLGEVTVDLSTLTFTNGNWNLPQTVTVTGANDVIDDGDQVTLVTIAIDQPATQDLWDGLPNQTVSVTTNDEDEVGVTATETLGTTVVTEAGSSDSFNVVLNAQPASDVVITVTSGDTGEATVDVSSLTFTSGDWNSPQTVTVTGVDDVFADGDQNTSITLSIDDANSDDQYDPVADVIVTATTTDDEVAGFSINEIGGNTVTDEDGLEQNFEVVLDAQPESNVVITITNPDPGELTLDVTVLTFTPANWDTPQNVQVNGVDDAIVDGSQFTNVVVAVDPNLSADAFDLLAGQTVVVETQDND